ncbi:hypothetical protein Arad_7591 [Rhizobium rhizogenes K84]|uniref:Uncharacterized protein n=1 Tax=Rhizobium rhizogenes (strain K84 / ATCC BAA-868) TaxID=311403 RepID=B9JNC4_RHIR8|nr:hypothetical protein Arad_7591 [Rhizobium rhizogenes K84]
MIEIKEWNRPSRLTEAHGSIMGLSFASGLPTLKIETDQCPLRWDRL